MFTYRDFEMGTLGLAWTGDLKNAGGVCEKNGVSVLFDHYVCYFLNYYRFSFLLIDCKYKLPIIYQLLHQLK